MAVFCKKPENLRNAVWSMRKTKSAVSRLESAGKHPFSLTTLREKVYQPSYSRLPKLVESFKIDVKHPLRARQVGI